jgi:plastocyanin
MPDALKVKSEEVGLTTAANTVSDGTLIRVVNTDTSDHVVTVTDASDVTLGSFTLGKAGSFYSIEYVRKAATDKIKADANTVVKATSVAYF